MITSSSLISKSQQHVSADGALSNIVCLSHTPYKAVVKIAVVLITVVLSAMINFMQAIHVWIVEPLD
jgi:hypothetical protein